MIRVGDHVYKNHGVLPLQVISMETVQQGQKYGGPVREAETLDRSLVVNLSNGSWAYGDQIDLVDRCCKQCGKPVERGCSEYCIGCEKVDEEKWDD